MPSNTIRQTLADSTPGYYRDDETGDYYRATELLADVVSGYAQPADADRSERSVHSPSPARENAAAESGRSVALETPAGTRTYGRLSHSSDSGGYDIDGRATRRNATSWSEGDVVEYDSDGHIGVVAGKLTSDFENPVGDGDKTVEVEASRSNPAYIVPRETQDYGVFRASDLKKGSFPDDVPGGDVDEVADAVANDRSNALTRENIEKNPWVGFQPGNWPNGWDRTSLLKFWTTVGGTWRTCHTRMKPHFGERGAEKFCSSAKDELMGTERWRGRF